MTDSSTRSDFLLELGTEELPPKALRVLELALAEALRKGLDSAGLSYGQCESFATPRRLAVRVSALDETQPDQAMEKRGPPVKIAFDENNEPTRAAVAFADGCGVEVSALDRISTPKGEWLAYKGITRGVAAAELLQDIISEALAALPVPKRMRWGAGDAEFVRPVHWLVLLLGNEVVPATVFGIAAGRETRGHRFHAPGLITIDHPREYEQKLAGEGYVMASFAERRERVVALVEESAAKSSASFDNDDALIDEVTALVEWPVAVRGTFDTEFLSLPDEVLEATLKVHQRYFPLRGKDGNLVPEFVAISNIESHKPDEVRKGNERVVRPRLADAAFFRTKDQQQSLASRGPALANVVYQRGLGSLAEKVERVTALIVTVAPLVGADETEAVRAAELSRCDLLTDMVGEFPELQGIVGSYYAADDGEPKPVSQALRELYLPGHAADTLPETATGQALALADRLDTLAGIFALGKKPTGNRDPFGLRRAALGVVRILVENRIEADAEALYQQAVALQPVKDVDAKAVVSALVAFTFQRMRAWYRDAKLPGLGAGDISAELFESVLARNPVSPLDFHERLLAVRDFSARPEAVSLAAANKRIGNILRSADFSGGEVNPAHLVEPAERALYEAVEAMDSDHRADREARRYMAILRRLAALRDPVDRFFDDVMVMAEDAQLQDNRLALLSHLHALFLDVADLSCLPGK